MPKISIVVPVHNAERYLDKTVLSLRNQLLEDIEIICVDDFSDDDSVKILIKHANADERVKIIRFEENKSSNQARKQGVLAATGDYIMFVDADDLLDERACSYLLTEINEKNVDVLHFGCEIINCNGAIKHTIEYLTRDATPDKNFITGQENLLKHWFSRPRAGLVWAKLFKANVVKQAFNEVEDLFLPRGQDVYAIFLIMYYSKSYAGLVDTSHEYYKYYYGRGGYGKANEEYDFFELLCTLANVAGAIERFLIQNDCYEKYADLHNKIKQNLLQGCTARYKNASVADKPQYFDCMLRYWGPETVIEYFSSNYWFQRLDISKILKKTELLNEHKVRKIRTVGAFYHSIYNGGAQRVCAELCTIWSEMGLNVILFTDGEPTADDYYVPPNVVRVELPSSATQINRNYIQRSKVLREAIEYYQIDAFVNHEWLAPCMMWDLLTVKSAGAYYIQHCHNIFSTFYINAIKNFYELPHTFSLADIVVTLSRTDCAYWSQFCPKVEIVKNPLTFDISDIQQAPLNNKNILWIARFSPEKRPEQAIEIMKLVVSEIPNAKLLFVGDSNDKNNNLQIIKSLVAKYELQENVEFIGFTNDIAEYYGNSSVMLSTSKYEGYLLTLAEALTFGVPIVTYDMPYLEFLRDGRGIVTVPQEDTQNAASQLIRILSDDDYRFELGNRARELGLELADYDFKAKWKSIFNAVSDGIAQKFTPEIEDLLLVQRVFFEHGEYHYAALSAVEKNVAGLRSNLKQAQVELDEVKNLKSTTSSSLPPANDDGF